MRVLELDRNTGFAHAANRGVQAAASPFVALVNTDVELAADWVARMASALAPDPEAASVACKMLSLDDPTRIYDAGDILRRDGACEQRGRFSRDDGRYDGAGRDLRRVRRRRAVPARTPCWRWGASTSATSRTSRMSTWRCDCRWLAGVVATSRPSRYTPVRDRPGGCLAVITSSSLATRWCSWPRRFRCGGCPTSLTASSRGPGTPRASGGFGGTSERWLAAIPTAAGGVCAIGAGCAVTRSCRST